MNRRGFFGTLFGAALGVVFASKAKAAEKEAVPYIAYLAVYVRGFEGIPGQFLSTLALENARSVSRTRAAYIPAGLFFIDSMETEPAAVHANTVFQDDRVAYVFRFHGRLIWGEKPPFDEAWRNRLHMRELAKQVKTAEWLPTLLGYPVLFVPKLLSDPMEYVLGNL